MNSDLKYAIENGELSLVEKLLENNPKWISSISEVCGSTPLHIAIENKQNEVALYLIGKIYETNAPQNLINMPRNSGATPFFIACQSNNLDGAVMLNSLNAEMNTVLKSGVTPLLKASAEGYTEIVQFLLDVGADVNAIEPINKTFPLYMASQNGHIETVRLLLDAGANYRAKNVDNCYARDIVKHQITYAKEKEEKEKFKAIFNLIPPSLPELLRDLEHLEAIKLIESNYSLNPDNSTVDKYISEEENTLLRLWLENFALPVMLQTTELCLEEQISSIENQLSKMQIPNSMILQLQVYVMLHIIIITNRVFPDIKLDQLKTTNPDLLKKSQSIIHDFFSQICSAVLQEEFIHIEHGDNGSEDIKLIKPVTDNTKTALTLMRNRQNVDNMSSSSSAPDMSGGSRK